MFEDNTTVSDLQLHNSFCVLNPEFRVLLVSRMHLFSFYEL